MTGLSDAEARIGQWVSEIKAASASKKTADAQADRQSLERAADLEAIYQAFDWVKDMPAQPRRPRRRGINPKSREQFAKWVRQRWEWGSKSYLSRLNEGHLFVATHELGNKYSDLTEGTLRPLATLRAEGYGEFQYQVWQAAVTIAGGTPTSADVRRAVREFIDARKPPVKNLASDPRTADERRAAQRAKLIADFDALLAEENRLAKDTLNLMIQHFNEQQRDLRETA